MMESNCEASLLQLVIITVIVLFLTTSISWVSDMNHFQYYAAAQIQLNESTSSSSNPNSNSNGTVITEGFLPYENSDLGIRVQYPADWELEPHTEGAAFLAPLENASDRYYESLNVYVYNPGALEYYPSNDTSLDEIVAGEIKSLQRHNDFQLEESNQTRISGDNIPAYELVYTYSDPNIGLAKAMEVLSTDGKSLYILVYTAKPADYPVHLQTIMKMIDSLQLTTESFILPSTFWTSDSTTVNLSNETGPLSMGAQIAAYGDNVYVVWEDNSNYTENYHKTDIFFTKSSDGGNTFDKPVNISNNRTTISWRAQIAAYGDNVYVVWERYNSTGQGKDDIFFTKSSDAGTTFSKPINLSSDNSNDTSSGMVDIAAASPNGVHVVWFDETSPGVGEIMYTKSSDNGTTFDKPVSINDNYTQGLAIEVSQFDTNNVYVVWSDVFGSEAGLFSDKVMFSQSTDGGNSFSEPRNINDNSTAGFIPSIDSSNNSSTVYVVWSEQNATGTEPTGITLVRSLDGGNEFDPPTHFLNITGLFGMAKVVASGDDDDEVYIVWNAGQDIFMKSSADGGNIFLDNPMNLSNNRAGFSSFEPDIGASDNALFIVWSTGVEGLLDKEEIMFEKIEK